MVYIVMMYRRISLAGLLLFSATSQGRQEDDFSFIVLADWHGAESFAKKGDAAKGYQEHLKSIKHIRETYGGELVMLPGDSNTGKWTSKSFRDLFDPSLTANQVVLTAGRRCYATMKKLFQEGGYGEILMAMGDHELGGNPWDIDSGKYAALSSYRKAFADGFNMNKKGEFMFSKPIGAIKSQPLGTMQENTSFAYRHKNVLFVTVDAFQRVSPKENVLDRRDGFGGEGGVTCTVEGDHLTWFENVLREARKDETIKHIFVQAHLPIMQPVRKVQTSGQFFDKAEKSQFWQLMLKYDVDLYFAGEVHATTVTKDSASNLVQIVSRGNMFSNFLKVEVTDNAITITSFNEIANDNGEKDRWNNNYDINGGLSIQKTMHNTTFQGTGALAFLDRSAPVVHFDFEDLVPMKSRQVLGLRNEGALVAKSIKIRGIKCTEAIPNIGSFGQQYDAQGAGVNLVKGVYGKTGLSLTASSRLALFATGPHSGGNEISYALWFKTSKTSKNMILVHYGDLFGQMNAGKRKDMFTLSLEKGIPKLYTSPEKVLTAKSQSLADDTWHHVAVTMPHKSCKLSEVRMFIDGKKVKSVLRGKDDGHIFMVTSGRVGIGSFGYSDQYFDNALPHLAPFVGSIDEFYMWSRSVDLDDVRISMRKSFRKFKNRKCIKLRSNLKNVINVGEERCQKRCSNQLFCRGYETMVSSEGESKCTLFNDVPGVGETIEGATCNLSLI